mmetsp:Transcript_19107/g.31832  ORF Transcript_19107/g.31832 Transcript_19107/m.31832 type:complete len:575 (+) Transcript_19107:136-1860(+)
MNLDYPQWLYQQMAGVALVTRELENAVGDRVFDVETQEAIYEKLFLDSESKARIYDVGRKYKLKMTKWIVDKSEMQDQPVFEPFLEIIMESLTTKYGENEWCYQTFSFASTPGKPLCSIRFRSGSINQVGLVPWEAGMMAVDFAVAYKRFFKGKSLVELGAGVGLSGILLKKVCELSSVLLTDYEQSVLDNLRHNVSVNTSDNSVRVAALDWTCQEHVESLSTANIIIAADCVYDPNMISPLLNVISTLLKLGSSTTAWLVQSERNRDTFKLFCDTLADMDISVVDETPLLPITSKSTHDELFTYENVAALFHPIVDRSKIRLFRANVSSYNFPMGITRIRNCSCCNELEKMECLRRKFVGRQVPCIVQSSVLLSPSHKKAWADKSGMVSLSAVRDAFCIEFEDVAEPARAAGYEYSCVDDPSLCNGWVKSFLDETNDEWIKHSRVSIGPAGVAAFSRVADYPVLNLGLAGTKLWLLFPPDLEPTCEQSQMWSNIDSKELIAWFSTFSSKENDSYLCFEECRCLDGRLLQILGGGHDFPLAVLQRGTDSMHVPIGWSFGLYILEDSLDLEVSLH